MFFSHSKEIPRILPNIYFYTRLRILNKVYSRVVSTSEVRRAAIFDTDGMKVRTANVVWFIVRIFISQFHEYLLHGSNSIWEKKTQEPNIKRL